MLNLNNLIIRDRDTPFREKVEDLLTMQRYLADDIADYKDNIGNLSPSFFRRITTPLYHKRVGITRPYAIVIFNDVRIEPAKYWDKEKTDPVESGMGCFGPLLFKVYDQSGKINMHWTQLLFQPKRTYEQVKEAGEKVEGEEKTLIVQHFFGRRSPPFGPYIHDVREPMGVTRESLEKEVLQHKTEKPYLQRVCLETTQP